MRKDGRRVLVTGGGSGIGRAIAVRMARAGNEVVATVRDQCRAAELTEEAARGGLGVRFLPLELADADAIANLAADLEGSGGVDLLIHNAGFGLFGAVEDVDAETAARQFVVHVFGPLSLTRLLLPGLRARRGRIVWVGSLAGRIALPFQAHYSAAKAAVATLSDAMRMELAPHGVHVTCIEPSDFSTGFTSARQVVRHDGSAYSDVAHRCLQEVERQERAAPDADWVARVVQAVADDPSPPARVPVGQNARTICFLLGLVPARLAERIIRAHYKV